MSLTQVKIKSTKAGDKPIKLFDGRGLYLEFAPSGGRWWRFKYRFEGKEKRLSLGVFPDVTLKDARVRCDDARKALSAGIDPSAHRKAAKATRAEESANSFEVITREWYAKHADNWAASHSKRVIRLFERDIFPWLGSRPIVDITAPELLAVMRRIEERDALETAHRALGNCGQVFRYAISTGRAPRDPAADLRGALPPVKGSHFAAITEPKRAGELLRMLEGYQGTLTVRCALKLAPLVFVRPGELRSARWADFDFEAAEWRYTVTKTATAHIVPLSRQALKILRDLQPVTGRGQYVFPSARSGRRPMSDNAILAAMRNAGIAKEEMTGHGFRAMARTILDEVLGFRPDLIEHQLAHAVRDPHGRAYNRTAHLPERRKMMQKWADYLDKLKAGAEVVKLPRSA
ncbi:MAG: integrase arm-type DNA-binding domain-containing protein [Proteobacteria bacterium]|nr:integrase arm-type DNA-binding domain-containing protein [Pseudomonadota bacterium]